MFVVMNRISVNPSFADCASPMPPGSSFQNSRCGTGMYTKRETM